MTVDEFAWLWHGIVQRPLVDEEAFLLQSVSVHQGPKKRAILLLHGFGSSPAVFRLMLPLLQSLYDGIEAPVLPGHASTLQDFAVVNALEWTRCAVTHCHQLCKQYEQVDVLGLSLGGVLACQLSQQFSLNHLYLLAPAFRLNVPFNWGALLPQLLMKLGIRSLPHQGGNLHSHQEAELVYRRIPLTALKTILLFVKTFHLIVPQCPIDLFLGRHDAVVNGFQVETLLKEAPHLAVHWLKHSAHVLPLDTDWREMIKVIQENHTI